jgi:iron complex outermembrane receptor protein
MPASRVASRRPCRRLIVALLCAPLLLRAPVVAQEPPPDTVRAHWLDTIVVTAPRIETPLAKTPAAVSVVGPQALTTMPRSIAVDEAVLLVPGVKVDNQADGKRVHLSIRGQGILTERGIRGVRVMLDGLPLNDPSGFAPDFYDVDWSVVTAVEVLRGPGASLYGGGSSAGVLNILTAPGGPAPAGGEASGTYGSHGFWKTTGDVGGASRNVTYRGSFTHSAGDGYRVHTAFRGDNVMGKVHWTPSPRVQLTPMVWYTRFFNDNAEGLNLTWLAQDRRMANPDALTYNEYQDTRRVTGGVVGRVDLGNRQTLSFTPFLRWTGYEESVPSSVQHRALWSPGGTLQYTIERSTGPLVHHVSVGSDVQWQGIDEYRHPNLGLAAEGPERLSDETIHQTGVGVFALDRLELGGRWGAILNLRYDRVGNRLMDHLQTGGVDLSGDASFERVTGRVGLTYAAAREVHLYANVGQGFLPPAIEELANNPAQLGGFNQDLSAALSRGEEVGARGMLGTRMAFDVSLFHLNTEKDFDRYRVPARPLETFYRNVGSSRRFGGEAYVSWTPVALVALQAAYTYSHFQYTNTTSAYGDISGHWLPNSPEHQLVVDVQLVPVTPISVGLTSETRSAWYVDPTNVARVDGYTLWHARAAYRLPGPSGLEVTAAVHNIFGTQYIAFSEPDPDGNSYQPAPEQEIFVGLKISP